MATSEKLLNGYVRKRTKALNGEESPSSMEPIKYRSLKEIMKVAPRCELSDESDDESNCEKCGCGDHSDEMLLCDKCNKGFHMFCLRPIVVRIPIGSWVCPSCSDEKKEEIILGVPLLKKRIVDFFGIEKVDGPEKSTAVQDGRKRRRRSLVMCKRRRRLLPFIPTKNNERRLEQMSSLANALSSLNMEFSNELTYNPSMAPRSANQAKFEYGGMQELHKDDIATFEQCRAMCKIGKCPPLRVVFDPLEGYTVEADSPIKDLTLIAEYTGDVDFIKNRENDDCDSMMTLLLATSPLESLVICPDKQGNIARFINGINNHSREGRKKQNLKCVRYNVNGECRVLLVAIRDIAKGERLYYNYNGYENAYPTHHFV